MDFWNTVNLERIQIFNFQGPVVQSPFSLNGG